MSASAGEIFAGIDGGNQPTKVLPVDGKRGEVPGAAAEHHLIEDLPPGHVEQHRRGRFAAASKLRRDTSAAKQRETVLERQGKPSREQADQESLMRLMALP